MTTHPREAEGAQGPLSELPVRHRARQCGPLATGPGRSTAPLLSPGPRQEPVAVVTAQAGGGGGVAEHGPVAAAGVQAAGGARGRGGGGRVTVVGQLLAQRGRQGVHRAVCGARRARPRRQRLPLVDVGVQRLHGGRVSGEVAGRRRQAHTLCRITPFF